MAIEITNDTVVKIIVRRGQESERLKVILSEGELGYTVDQARLFVGDGVTPGGRVVGNQNFGPVPVPTDYIPYLKDGDLIFDVNRKDFLGYQKGVGLYSVQPQQDIQVELDKQTKAKVDSKTSLIQMQNKQ
jgi:hypothetical protein